MGLFDNIGQDRSTGQMTFVQQAKAFGTLNLNAIFVEGTKAAIDIVKNASEFFADVFGRSDCNDQDRVLYERMKDQLPGMIIVLVKLGWEDSSNLNAFNDNPQRADYGGRPHGAFPCNQGIGPARALFTTLFGVRIINSNGLDALDQGVDAYYRLGETIDIPREAVVRAVRLKQTYFPNSTYNRQLWDLQKFQENPLVAPIPDPNVIGKLFTGNIFGVDVVNGLVQGDPIPNLPTDTRTPFDIRGPWGGIIYPAGNPNTAVINPTSNVPATTENFIDKIISFVKTSPLKALGAAGVVLYVAYELDQDD